MEPINIAIVGFENGHVFYLFRAIKNNPMFRIVACSFAPRQRIIHENRFGNDPFNGIDCYYDEEQMYDAHPEIEACVLGGSNDKHMQEFRLCAERGIHVISMKVPTLNMAEYDEMLRLSKERKIKVHIELEMRWQASVERVKEVMESGELGKITSFTAYNYSHFPFWWQHWMDIPEQSYGRRIPLHKSDKRFRGGALTDHPHIFDLVRYMTGSEFDTVYAVAAPNMRDGAETEDLVYVIGKMKNGMAISLDPSYANREYEQTRVTSANRMNHYPRSVQVELAVSGTKGAILCDAYNANTIEELIGADFEYRVEPRAYSIENTRAPFLKNFARNIRLGDEYAPLLTLEEHKKTMLVINACYESIYSGKPVKIEY